MKVNQKKANQIMGMFATLNKIELDKAIARGVECRFTEFNCKVAYSEIYGCFDCELTSYGMSMANDYSYSEIKLRPRMSTGGHWPTDQTVWDDPCKYSEFEYVVRFVRNAIRADGLSNMKYASRKVTVDMPDYLAFE